MFQILFLNLVCCKKKNQTKEKDKVHNWLKKAKMGGEISNFNLVGIIYSYNYHIFVRKLSNFVLIESKFDII